MIGGVNKQTIMVTLIGLGTLGFLWAMLSGGINIIIAAILSGIFAILFYLTYFTMWVAFPRAFNWGKTAEPYRVRAYVQRRPDQGGNLSLRIKNNEFSAKSITVSEFKIEHIGVDGAGGRSNRVNSEDLPVKRFKSGALPFITEKSNGGFTIVEHDGDQYKPEYSFGKHKFNALIVYSVGRSQGHYQWYRIVVDYPKIHDFKVQITPMKHI